MSKLLKCFLYYFYCYYEGADGMVGWKVQIAEKRKTKVVEKYAKLIDDVDRGSYLFF